MKIYTKPWPLFACTYIVKGYEHDAEHEDTEDEEYVVIFHSYEEAQKYASDQIYQGHKKVSVERIKELYHSNADYNTKKAVVLNSGGKV